MTIAEKLQSEESDKYQGPESTLPVENITPKKCLASIEKKLRKYGQEGFPGEVRRLADMTQSAYEESGRKCRKNGKDLSVTHPLWIADKLLELGITDEKALKAAILHDVLEDTSKSYEDIKNLTDKETAEIVLALTYIKTKNVKDLEGTKMRLITGSLETNLLVAVIKACDVLHNFHTDSALPPQTRKERASLALSFYEPWLRGLGFESLADEIGEAAIERLQPQKTKKIREIQKEIKKHEIEKLISDLFESRVESLEGISGIKLSPPPVIKVQYPGVYRVYQKAKGEIDFQVCLPEVEIVAGNTLQTKILKEILAENNKTITLPNGGNRTIYEINIKGACLQINTDFLTSEDEITPADLVLRPNLEAKQRETAHKKYERLKNSLQRILENGEKTLSPIMLEVLKKGNIYFVTKDGDFFYAPRESTCLDAAYMIGKNLGNDAVGVEITRDGETFTVIFSPDSPPELLREGDELTFETTDNHRGTTPIDPRRMDMVNSAQAIRKISKQLKRQRQWLTQEQKIEVEKQTIVRGIKIVEGLYEEARGKRLDIHIGWAFEEEGKDEMEMRNALIDIGSLPFSRIEKNGTLTEKIDELPKTDNNTSKAKDMCEQVVNRLIQIRENLPTLIIQLPNDQPGILKIFGDVLKESGDSVQIRTTAVNDPYKNSGKKPQEIEIVFLPSGPQNVGRFISQVIKSIPESRIKILKKDQ